MPKPKRGHSQSSDFYKSKFEYCAERDVYICPAGKELFHRKHAEANKTPKELYANTQACKACTMIANSEIVTGERRDGVDERRDYVGIGWVLSDKVISEM